MKIERRKNAARNIKFGFLLKLYQLIIPFVMRTAFLYILGVQYLGLNSLFTSILQVLNLAELGIGSAMVYSMYKPIAEDDSKTICALMKLYRIYYRTIGLVIAGIGMILLPFIPVLISGAIPNDINVYVLYLLNLSATVISYWLFAYKNCLLDAHQRIDISSKISLIMITIQYILQIVVLVAFRNYYLYLIIALLTQTISNIVVSIVVSKMYPKYKAIGKLEDKEIIIIKNRIRDLFTAKLGSVIVSSVDTIIISAFLGLEMLAIYQNYYYVMNSVIAILGVIFTSILAAVGNSIIVDSSKKVYEDFKMFSFGVNWIMTICITCFICIYQPFMKIWVGESLMLDFKCVILFAVYFYVFEQAMIWATYKDAAGLWHKDRLRPLIGAIVNLIINIILVNFIGIYGVLLSTVISYILISMPWLLHNLFKYLFKISAWDYIKETVFYLVLTILSSILAYWICSFFNNLDGVLEILLKLLIAITTSNVVFLILNIRNEKMKKVFDIVIKLLIKSKKNISI